MSEKLLQQILDKLNSIETKVENIESTQHEYTQLLRVLEHRTDVIGAKVIAMEETIQRSEGRITSLEKATLAIKEDANQNHKETIEKLETLDSSVIYLANKFTQHDMQLFDMKRRAK